MGQGPRPSSPTSVATGEEPAEAGHRRRHEGRGPGLEIPSAVTSALSDGWSGGSFLLVLISRNPCSMDIVSPHPSRGSLPAGPMEERTRVLSSSASATWRPCDIQAIETC